MFKLKTNALCAMALATAWTSAALASSHREAPAIAEDQYADNTDVYAFISPTDPDNVVLVANYVPLLLPYSGPNFYKFSDNVRYEICIDNDGDARRDLCYRWEFRTTLQNNMTFLYNTGVVDSLTDTDLNVRQTYTLTRVPTNGPATVIMANVPVAPWNVGSRTFPGNTYDTVANQAITTTPSGYTMFAGPRDEPFFVDLRVFDLLGVGAGFAATDGVNVMSLVLEVPITEIADGGVRPAAGTDGLESQIGVFARSLRRRETILAVGGPAGRPARYFGEWTQVSRLGWPLVNEGVIPLRDKDGFNRTPPHRDVLNFGAYVLNPELAILLDAVLGLPCNTGGNRMELVGLLAPNATTPADLLRLNIEEGQTFADSAFPNGRWLEDDVTDVILTAICSGDFTVPVSDGVNANDLPFSQTFPYLPSPSSGNPG